MNVLILTNEMYMDFVQSCIPFPSTHSFFVYYQPYKYDFENCWSYDIGISFMYQYKIPSDQIKSNPWINFHPGPLPEYKGRNLCYHAILNGEKAFGASIHYMDEGFDTGPIIDVLYFPIEPEDTAESVSEKAIDTSKKLFQRYFLPILMCKRLNSYENVGGTYYKKEPISNYIQITSEQERQVRAITYGFYKPKIKIGNTTYKIVRENG